MIAKIRQWMQHKEPPPTVKHTQRDERIEAGRLAAKALRRRTKLLLRVATFDSSDQIIAPLAITLIED